MSKDREQQEQAQDLRGAQDDMAKVKGIIDSEVSVIVDPHGRPSRS